MTCRICGSENLIDRVNVREMMFGSRELFEYVRCGDCRSLQIAVIPADLSQYYSSDTYYSFNNRKAEPFWKGLLKRWVAGRMIGNPESIWRNNPIFARIGRNAEPWIAHIEGLTHDSSILDFGCGEGARLERLALLGFSNLTGIDAFLPEERAGTNSAGVTLIRGELAEHDGRYDCITMHHSLEHIPEPGALLSKARALLKPGGSILVRLPLLQDDIWSRFGANWAQVDAPRHLHLFTVDSFLALAARSGLQCVAKGTDMLGWSLAWSTAWAQDIPCNNPDGSPNELPLDKARLAAFDSEAQRLNARNEGDQGYFVLTPA